ncbi:MAG: GNAT family N-acetyltransferase [Alphaproteobacteria bacterium]
MSDGPLHVRSGESGDLAALLDIYNHYVRETTITFDIEPLAMDAWRDWFAKFAETGPHRLLVGVDPASELIVAYAYAAQFRAKPAYNPAVEVTVYTAPGKSGNGAGTVLYRALFEALAGEDVHRAYAAITLPNLASEALHARFGFRQIGVLTQVGRKFGRYHDVGWWEKDLSFDTSQ